MRDGESRIKESLRYDFSKILWARSLQNTYFLYFVAGKCVSDSA